MMTGEALLLEQWQRACEHKASLRVHDAVVRHALARVYQSRHGHFDVWLKSIAALPTAAVMSQQLDQASPSVSAMLTPAQEKQLKKSMTELLPWRKGPFSVCGLNINSEWRSDLKYQRVLDSQIVLKDKQVLDVGSGNGYFLYRLLGSGARLALGVDPSWHCFSQFLAMQHFYQQPQACYLPLTLDDCLFDGFDVSLSMGVLYHRRNPLEHLSQLRASLRDGGYLLLETLVVDGDAQTVLLPESRYAGMRNVWFLPSVAALRVWLQRLGLAVQYQSEVVATSSEEQRSTSWSQRHSLADFMQADFQATIEGLPPPKRVLILAQKK